jgi:hypothetical protein
MKLTIKLFVLTMVLTGAVFAQTETAPKVTLVTMPANSEAGEITGSIKDGQKINLRWAESSQVACFPGTRFEMFDGNQVFYRITLPAASSMVITLTPKDNAQLSLYALRQGSNPRDQAVPPNVTRAISCEASYPIYANISKTRVVKNKDDGTRKVEYISVNSPYSILIGVAGAKGLTEGDFTLNFTIKPR